MNLMCNFGTLHGFGRVGHEKKSGSEHEKDGNNDSLQGSHDERLFESFHKSQKKGWNPN